MATFKYSAISKDGKKVTGMIEGFSELDAATKIKEMYSIVVQISEVKEQSGSGNLLALEIGGNKLNDKAFTLMCSQFSVILRAGIGISRAVELVASKMSDKPLKRVLAQVSKDVEGGRSLSASFSDRGKKLLPLTFLETIHAGEESGNLDMAFDSVSKHYTKQSKMRSKVKGAMIYPAFVLVVAVVVVIVLMVKVVPVFMEMFTDLGAELPLPTRMLIAMSTFFRKYYLVMIAVISAFLLGLKLYSNTETGRLNLAKLQLKLPILGNIAVLNGASTFANTMAMMLNAGLSMTKSVTITSRVISNYHVSQEIGKITGKLEEGHTLGRSLRDSGCLPDILIDMATVGEDSGELAGTLSMTAEYYDNELEDATAAALATLEPAILVFLAGFAGFIVIAIYMAMFSMYAAM